MFAACTRPSLLANHRKWSYLFLTYLFLTQVPGQLTGCTLLQRIELIDSDLPAKLRSRAIRTPAPPVAMQFADSVGRRVAGHEEGHHLYIAAYCLLVAESASQDIRKGCYCMCALSFGRSKYNRVSTVSP